MYAETCRAAATRGSLAMVEPRVGNATDFGGELTKRAREISSIRVSEA